MKDKALWFFAAIVVLLTLGLCFSAQGQYYSPCPGGVCPTGPSTVRPSQPPQQPSTRPATWCDLRIKVDDRDNGNSWGSGTPVRKYNGGTIVLTNCHVVDSRASDTSITVYRQNSPPVGARVLGADPDIDVAVLLVNEDWPVVELAESFDEAGSAQTRGFAHAKTFTCYSGRVTARIKRGFFISAPAINGMSGGGVFQNQKYVGILWGGARDYTAVTTVTHIRPFLDRILGRQRVDVIVTPQPAPKPTPAPPQQPNTPPPACPDCESCDCDEKISKLIDLHADLVVQMQRMEGSIDAKIDKRFAELKIPEPTDLTQIELKIAQLEADLKREQARTIKLEIYRAGELVGVSEGRHTVRFNVDELE